MPWAIYLLSLIEIVHVCFSLSISFSLLHKESLEFRCKSPCLCTLSAPSATCKLCPHWPLCTHRSSQSNVQVPEGNSVKVKFERDLRAFQWKTLKMRRWSSAQACNRLRLRPTSTYTPIHDYTFTTNTQRRCLRSSPEAWHGHLRCGPRRSLQTTSPRLIRRTTRWLPHSRTGTPPGSLTRW